MSVARNIGGEDLGQETSMTKVGVAAFIGALVEWYDYFLYGLAASVVFTKLFFPTENPLIGTLAAFATFGVGFFFRPVGGAIFGHYGDRLGRKSILVLTLLLMGLATFLIGVLPTFQSVGLLAPVLLVVLRALQGVAVGGEWGGAALLVVEHAPGGRRGFYGSWPQMGSSRQHGVAHPDPAGHSAGLRGWQRRDVRNPTGLLRRAVRDQRPIQRGLFRLPALGCVRGRSGALYSHGAARLGGKLLARRPVRAGDRPHQFRLRLPGHGVIQGGSHRGTLARTWRSDGCGRTGALARSRSQLTRRER